MICRVVASFLGTKVFTFTFYYGGSRSSSIVAQSLMKWCPTSCWLHSKLAMIWGIGIVHNGYFSLKNKLNKTSSVWKTRSDHQEQKRFGGEHYNGQAGPVFYELNRNLLGTPRAVMKGLQTAIKSVSGDPTVLCTTYNGFYFFLLFWKLDMQMS